MNDQANLSLPEANRAENLVKRDHYKIDLVRRPLQPELQRQKRAGHRARNGDLAMRHILAAQAFFGHQHRAVTVAHAGATGQQRIERADVRVGVNADGGNVQFAARGQFVQSLDVAQDMGEFEAAGRNQFLGQPIKHKSVIRIRRMSQRQGL